MLSRLTKTRPEVGFCVACQLLMLAASLPFYSSYGLRVEWSTGVPQALVMGLLVALLFNFWYLPGAAAEWIAAETVLAACLLFVISCIASPAQYLAVAVGRPLIDPWLAAADASLGIHVPALAEWTREHPSVRALLYLAYFSLLPQFVGVLMLLGLVYRNSERLWEYLFHFHLCGVLTVASLALFPAACAFSYYGFDSTLPQGRFLAHFNGFRTGSLSVIRFDDLEGLISMPSFHVAGGLMLTWAFRGYRVVWVFAVLNGLLMAATVLSGAHYGVDLPATALLFGASVVVHRLLLRWFSEPHPAVAESPAATVVTAQ